MKGILVGQCRRRQHTVLKEAICAGLRRPPVWVLVVIVADTTEAGGVIKEWHFRVFESWFVVNWSGTTFLGARRGATMVHDKISGWGGEESRNNTDQATTIPYLRWRRWGVLVRHKFCEDWSYKVYEGHNQSALKPMGHRDALNIWRGPNHVGWLGILWHIMYNLHI